MSAYDREWYKKDSKNRRFNKDKNTDIDNKSQKFWDTAWEEIEPSHSKKKTNSASSI